MKAIQFKIKAKDSRNELHFEIQRNNKHIVFKDRTKYSRKVKHKKNYYDE